MSLWSSVWHFERIFAHSVLQSRLQGVSLFPKILNIVQQIFPECISGKKQRGKGIVTNITTKSATKSESISLLIKSKSIIFSFKLSKSAMKTYKESFVSGIFFAVLLNSKYFFRNPDLRLRNPKLESGSGRRINYRSAGSPCTDPDPTTIFLRPLKKIFCPVDIKSLNIIKY